MSDSVQPHRRQPTRLPCPWDSPGKNTGVGCHFLLQCMKVKSESEAAQSYPTLSDPMDCSLYQAPLSTGFSRQEYWSGLPLPSPNLRLWETNSKKLDLVKNPTEFEIRFSLPDPPCKMSAWSSLSSWTFEALSKEHS